MFICFVLILALREELRPDECPARPEITGVSGFDSKQLKHVETEEKGQLPTKEGEYSSTGTRAVTLVSDHKLLWVS